MRLLIISFTKKGKELALRLANLMRERCYDPETVFRGRSRETRTADLQTPACGSDRSESIAKSGKDASDIPLSDIRARAFAESAPLSDICARAFADSIPLVFVGAAGIAVRHVAPFVKDKLTDPPVIVIDELGRYVIPILSGYMGGANELASVIADAIDAVPVITTATDINEVFSVDLFAKEHSLRIVNRNGIAKVSSSALSGRPVTISIKDYPPQKHVDVTITDEADPGLTDMSDIVLCPKRYAIGIGCRRGKSYEEIRDFVQTVLDDAGIDLREAGCIATIDIKKDEAGLRSLSQAWRMPLITFDAEVLGRVKGDFTTSDFVAGKVGVDNVCERAAVLAAGKGSDLIVRKKSGNGITAAVAERRPAAGK